MRIGIDLGGTKIEAIAISDDSAVLVRRRVPTPAGNYPGILQTVVDLVWSADQEVGARGSVGIASPGAISPRTGLIKNSNSPVLNGKPPDRDIAEKLGRPVRIENDANCL